MFRPVPATFRVRSYRIPSTDLQWCTVTVYCGPCKRYNVIPLKLMRLWPCMRVLLVYCMRQVLPHTVYQQQQPISFSKYRPIEMSPLWRLEFWGCSYTFRNLCTPSFEAIRGHTWKTTALPWSLKHWCIYVAAFPGWTKIWYCWYLLAFSMTKKNNLRVELLWINFLFYLELWS